MAVDKLVDSTQLDADLGSVADAIRAKSGGTGSLAFPAGFVTEIGNISGGGSGYGYTLLGSVEFTCSTTGTSSTAITGAVVTANRASHTAKMLYIRIRDKAGKRNGYFFGSDTFWLQPVGGSSQNNYRLMICMATSSAGKVEIKSQSQYGVFPQSPPTFSTGSVTVKAYSRYNSGYSGTINGTYVMEVYDLDWPDGVAPFA